MIDDRPDKTLASLLARLPFRLDDLEHVNVLFTASRASGDRGMEVQIELWTYCFVRRYFSLKLARDAIARSSDLDALMDLAYKRIRKRTDSTIERYGSWVSVLCRNTFLNYVRDRRIHVSDSAVEPAESHSLLTRSRAMNPVLSGSEDRLDWAVAFTVVELAITRLPRYLQRVARLRILDDMDYDGIAVATGRPVATVRAYYHKAVGRLRRDPSVRRVLGRDNNTPTTTRTAPPATPDSGPVPDSSKKQPNSHGCDSASLRIDRSRG